MEAILKNLKKYEKFVDQIEKHKIIADQLLDQDTKYLLVIASSAINKLKEIEEQIPKCKLHSYFELFHNYANYNYQIDIVMEQYRSIHKDYVNYRQTGLSDTFSEKSVKLFNKLSINYKRHKKKYFKDSYKLSNLMSKNIIKDIFYSYSNNNVKIKLEDINNKYNRFPESVILFATVMDKTIEELENKQESNVILFIENIIEENKNKVLKISNKKNSNVNSFQNPPLSSFGLMSMDSSIMLPELIKKLFNIRVKGSTSISQLDSLCKKEKRKLIIINSINQKATEILSENLIKNNIKLKKGEGLTKKSIEELSTVRKFKRTDKWNFSIKVLGDQKSKKYHIIEALTESSFRPLTMEFPVNYVIHENSIHSLLDFIKRGRKDEFSNRRTNYFNIQFAKASKNMFLPQVMDLDLVEERAEKIEMSFLKKILVVRIKDLFIKTVKKEHFISKKAFINKAINNPKILNTFENLILEEYKKQIKKLNKDPFILGEIMISFFDKLYRLSKNFNEKLYDKFTKYEMEGELIVDKDDSTKVDRKFREINNSDFIPENISIIRDIYIKQLENVIGEIITDEDNMFQSMYKMQGILLQTSIVN